MELQEQPIAERLVIPGGDNRGSGRLRTGRRASTLYKKCVATTCRLFTQGSAQRILLPVHSSGEFDSVSGTIITSNHLGVRKELVRMSPYGPCMYDYLAYL